MKMRVRCERDGTTFDVVPSLYQTRRYDVNGDKRVVCPTCGRSYFHYDNGETLPEIGEEGKTGWHSDRPLTIVKRGKI